MREPSDAQRIDRWLWTIRIFKTRSLAVKAVRLGQVSVNGQRTKASRTLKCEDTVDVRTGVRVITIIVKGFAPSRVSASVAQTLYEETAESVERREALRAAAKAQPRLPSPDHRPDKRARSKLRAARGKDP